MTKKLFALCVGLFTTLIIQAQVKSPVSWIASYKAASATEGEITISATIDKGWHTYSQQPNDAVPLPTLFSFKESKHYELVGKTEELNAHEEQDEALGAKLLVFTDKAEFKQKVKFTAKDKQAIFFKVEYIVCDNKMCMPPTTVDLSVKVQ